LNLRSGIYQADQKRIPFSTGAKHPAGVGEPGLELAVRLADDLTEGVVADVVDDGGGAGGNDRFSVVSKVSV